MNAIDLVAIVPFYISIILSGSNPPPLYYTLCPGLHDMKIISKAGTMIRLVRKTFSLKFHLRSE